MPAATVAAIRAEGAAVTALDDDYDAAVFLYHPLAEPLGIAIKRSTEGEANLDAMSITFVMTVLLMVVQGVVLWLVYGRAGRSGDGAALAMRWHLSQGRKRLVP